MKSIQDNILDTLVNVSNVKSAEGNIVKILEVAKAGLHVVIIGNVCTT